MEEILIELSNPLQSYFAGQMVEGQVIIKNRKPLQLKDVTILLQGKGEVNWDEEINYSINHRDADGYITRTSHYSYDNTYKAQETYVSQKICLAGDGQNVFVLAAGKTIYPFQFQLPSNCPSSFCKLCSGKVLYTLEAKVTPTMPKTFQECIVYITVIGIVDLNADIEMSQPKQLAKVKTPNFLLCRKGPNNVVLKLSRLGFVPGEILDFSCEITNNSNKKVKVIQAYFLKVAQFHGIYKKKRKKTQMKTTIISMVKGPEVEAGDYELWAPNCIRIPPLIPSSLKDGLCRIMDIQYSIQIKVQVSDVSGWAKPMFMELPVVIGTIPLKSTFDTLRNQRYQMLQSQEPLPEMVLSHPDYPDLPPPVFIRDCVDLEWKRWYGYLSDPNYMTYCYKLPNELSANSLCLPLKELRFLNAKQDTVIIRTKRAQRSSVLASIKIKV